MAKKRKKFRTYNYFEIINYNSPKISIGNWIDFFFITFILGAFICLIISITISSEENISRTFLTFYPFFSLPSILTLLNRYLKSPYLIPLIYILDFQIKLLAIIGIFGIFLLNLQKFLLFNIFLVYIFSAITLLLNDQQCIRVKQFFKQKKDYSKREKNIFTFVFISVSLIIRIIFSYTSNKALETYIMILISFLFIILGYFLLLHFGIRTKLLILDLIRQKQSTSKE